MFKQSLRVLALIGLFITGGVTFSRAQNQLFLPRMNDPVILDGVSNEKAIAFFTTPSGLRLDFTVSNDAQGPSPYNLSWNTFWDVKTVLNNEG